MSGTWKDYSQYHIAIGTFIRKNVDIDKEYDQQSTKICFPDPVSEKNCSLRGKSHAQGGPLIGLLI